MHDYREFLSFEHQVSNQKEAEQKAEDKKIADQLIENLERQFPETKRRIAIDLALKNYDKESFMALTSDGWEQFIK